MKNKKYYVTRLLTALLFVVAGVLVMPHRAEAKKLSVSKITYVDITASSKKYGDSLSSVLEIKNSDVWKDEIVAASVKNKSIAQVKKGEYYYILYPKKAGKTKLTFTVQRANGKQETLQTTLVTQKYKNPLKTIKIGKYNYIKRYKSQGQGQRSFEDNVVKGKLQVKAAKGWTLVSIKKRYYHESTGKWKLSTLKNGKTYKFLGSDMLVITLKDKKTKFIRTCTLDGMG